MGLDHAFATIQHALLERTGGLDAPGKFENALAELQYYRNFDTTAPIEVLKLIYSAFLFFIYDF